MTCQEHIYEGKQRNWNREAVFHEQVQRRTVSVKWQQPVAAQPPLRQQQFSSPEAGE